MVIYALVRVEKPARGRSQTDWPFSRAGRMLDVACYLDTSGHCDPVRAVARNTNSQRKVHWKTAVGFFAFT